MDSIAVVSWSACWPAWPGNGPWDRHGMQVELSLVFLDQEIQLEEGWWYESLQSVWKRLTHWLGEQAVGI